MKFYQLCVLICVTSCAIANLNMDFSPECIGEVPEMFEIWIREYKCQKQLKNRDEFVVNFNATVLEYNGNADGIPAVQEFLNKYCTKALDFLECFLSTIPEISELECQAASKKHYVKQKLYNGLKAIATYSCDNDAEMVKKLIPHDGLHFVFFNTDFKRCYSATSSPNSIEEFCAILETSQTCMLTASADQENKDIAVLINKAIAKAKNKVGCLNSN